MNPATTPMVVRPVDTTGVSRVNREFTELFGYTGEQLIAKPLLDWIHVDDRAKFEEIIAAQAGCVRAHHRTSNDDWVALDWRVKTHDGELVVLGLLNSPREPGAQSWSDSRPATSRATLANALEGMVRITEAKNPGLRCSILLVDEQRKRITVGAGPSFPEEYNRAVEGLQIGPRVGSCGTAAYWNVPVVVEDIYKDPLWSDLLGAASVAGVAACWSHPITSASGDVLGAMALYASEPTAPERHQMDALEIAARMVGLTIEHVRLEEQLRRTVKMEALGVLAGGIAHDFNNMLATVVGNAELAVTKLPEGSDVRRMVDNIITASTSATGLCSQMLAYAGRSIHSTETVECNALIRELSGLLKVVLSKKVTLEYELCDRELGVEADSTQIHRVVMNLITNASEAIGDNDGQILVTTNHLDCTPVDLSRMCLDASLAPGEYVQLKVNDTGCGMDKETQAKVFDPFFSTKDSGHGLGLAAVHGIVAGCQGALLLDSEVDEGTTFTVLLPRVNVDREQTRSATERPQIPAGLRVLVVDDEPMVRDVLGKMLEDAGFGVTYAADGQEAIAVFTREAESIDCVLLDLSMPKLSGGEVLRELKRIRNDVRVVLISGFAEQEILDRFEGAGLAGVLKKPTRKKALVDKICQALGIMPAPR